MQTRILYLALTYSTLTFGSVLAEPHVVPLGPFGGDVRSLAAHSARSDTFFLGTADGQIYVSRDCGNEWERLTPGLNRRQLVIDNLAFDPRSPDVLYAAAWELKSSQGRLFRTLDAGGTWESLSLGSFQSAIRAIAISPSEPDVLALGISEGVILSADAGRTWQRISRGYRGLRNVESLAFDPKDSNTLYAGTWHLGFKTTNRGKTWQPIHKGMVNDSDMFSLQVDPNQREILYASACTGIYRSDNGGMSWTKLKNGLPPDAIRTRTLTLDPSDSTRIYAGTTVGLFVSSDSGASWRRLLPEVVVNTVIVHPSNSRIVLVGTDDAGVFRSQDGGATFEPINQGFSHRQISAVSLSLKDPRRTYVAVMSDRHFGGFFMSKDGGANWEIQNEGLGEATAYIRVLLPDPDSNLVYLGTSRGLFSGVPGEQPWASVESARELEIWDLGWAGLGDRTLFLATSAGAFRLDPETGTLNKVTISVYEGKVNCFLNVVAAQQLFVGTEIGVFRSDDGGESWNVKVQGLPYTPVFTLELYERRLLCGTRNGLFFSDDRGETWNAGQGVYPLDIMTIKENPSTRGEVYAADSLVGYLFRSRDGGARWEVLNAANPLSRIARLLFMPSGELLAGTLSDGLCLIRTTGGRETQP